LKNRRSRSVPLILIGVAVVVSGAIITLKAIPRAGKSVERPTAAAPGVPNTPLASPTVAADRTPRAEVETAPVAPAAELPAPLASRSVDRAQNMRAAQPSNRDMRKLNGSSAASRPPSGLPIDGAATSASPASAEPEKLPAPGAQPAPRSEIEAGGSDQPVSSRVAPATESVPRAANADPPTPPTAPEKPREEPPSAPGAPEPLKSAAATLSRTQPRLLKGSTPEYPKVLRSAGVGGLVDVQVTIDETGRVTDATAVSGPPPLRSIAERTVRTWRYEPATVNGVQTASRTTVSFRFSER
jgi:TonB family protein